MRHTQGIRKAHTPFQQARWSEIAKKHTHWPKAFELGTCKLISNGFADYGLADYGLGVLDFVVDILACLLLLGASCCLGGQRRGWSPEPDLTQNVFGVLELVVDVLCVSL